MAAKFTIFCDEDSPTSFEPANKLTAAANSQANSQAAPLQQQQLQHQQQELLSIKQQQQHQAKIGPSDTQQQQHGGILQQQLKTTSIINDAQQPFNGKREPLGLRQATSLQHQRQLQQQQQAKPISQSQQSSQASVLQEIPSTSLTTSSSSAALSINEEDQENDISMASLGSDFIPSILHESEFVDDNSFEMDEGEEGAITTSTTTTENDLYAGNGALVAEDELAENDYDEDEEDFLDDDDDELQMELSQAFKQHDDSQLFKSAVYIDDIEKYLFDLERKPELRPLPNYMAFQSDIDSDKRVILFNWLVEVSDEYELQTETLFICTSIIDRFLSKMSVPTANFQLLGVAAMFIASKYEEIYPPSLNQFVDVTDDTYTGKEIRQMEREILRTLNFRISLPTVTLFLRRIFAFNKLPKRVFHLAEYLCYLSLLADQPFLEYYPSEIALASVILAAHQLDAAGNISPELRSCYDKSNRSQLERRQLPAGLKSCDIDRRVYIVNENLPFCIESLRAIQEIAHSRSSRVYSDSAIYVRYSSDTHGSVAQLQPPKAEDLLKY